MISKSPQEVQLETIRDILKNPTSLKMASNYFKSFSRAVASSDNCAATAQAEKMIEALHSLHVLLGACR